MQHIESTECLRRILALPRRSPVPPEGLAEKLTELLRTPKGGMTLRPLQALALHDIGTCGGAFLPLDVGEGKTLVSLLAPYVLDAKRPLLLLPANLIQKTAREARALSEHWLIPSNIRLMSYQMLGLVHSARDVDVYAPDLIIADECQKLKNRDNAAVARRVERYLEANPGTKFVGMTGTIMRRSLRDFAHILRWALKDKAPVPLRDSEVDEWALALDERIENEFQRIEPGALLELAAGGYAHLDPVVAARRGFRKRLRETPGVVASAESGTVVDVGLTIRTIRYEVSPVMREHFRVLREDKVAPNGDELWEAADTWRHAREMALGFAQRWDPQPPEDWRQARKEWFQFVRGVLQRSRTWDSPEHVAQACDAGKLPGHKLAVWRRIKDSFIPNPVPVWHDDTAIRMCAQWMREPGLVWTEHVPFAERLAQVTGAKYYGAKGLAADGEFIDDAYPGRSIIVSVDANREGRNLQKKWHRNLITTPMEGADVWQQLLGRTHRPGQERDVVVDVLLGCLEHAKAWVKACAGAVAIRDTVGAESKLLIADVDWPDSDEVASWGGEGGEQWGIS